MASTAARELSDMAEKFSSPARVLVVDDEALIRWSLTERLSSAGYDVREAEDGASTLSYFHEGVADIDVVVLDLKLPDADGVDLLKQIKHVCPTCHIILMTAYDTPDRLLDARTAGAFEVVTKPFALDTMLQTVDRALA